MTENAGKIVYEVDADTSKLVTSEKAANDSLDNLQKGFDKTDAAAKRTKKAVDDSGAALEKHSKSTDKASGAARGFSTVLTPLAGAIAGLVALDTLKRLQALSEQFTLLEARVTRLSGSSQQAAVNYQQLLNVASKTGQSAGETVKLWESLTGTLRELGTTDAQVIRLTETLQKIGTIGGSSVDEMSGALRQFGQGIAGGVIRAEEFNAVVEGMPQLAREIAKGLGVPFSELRKLLLDGELTAEKVLEAIRKRTEEVDKEFAKLPRTVGQAAAALTNEFGAAISKLDQAVGGSRFFAWLIDNTAKGIRLSAGNLSGFEQLNVLLAEQATLQERIAKARQNPIAAQSAEIKAAEARLEAIRGEVKAIQDRRVEEQKTEGGSITSPNAKPGGDAQSLKALETLKEQAALAKLTGEERAKLAAVQKLGAKASIEERAAAEALAVEIYRADNARKSTVQSIKAEVTEQKKLDEQRKKGAEDNVEAVTKLATELSLANLKGRELAQAQATLSLNQYATPEQVAQVKALADAVFDLKQKQANKDLAGQVDPLIGGQQAFELRMQQIKQLEEAEVISKQRSLELQRQAQVAHDEQMQVLREEDFRKQSMTNELLMASLDQVAVASKNALVGLVTGANNGTDAVRTLAGAILNEAVGALVNLGVEQVKAIVMGQTAQAAATATGVAQAATLTAAYAPAAAAASVASFGGAAAAGLAALASAIPAALGLFGGRQYGGPTQAGGAYRINENGAPEVWQDRSGRQYMMANRAGQVISNEDATSGGGSTQVIVNLIESSDRAGQVEQQRNADGNVEVNAFVADIMGGGQRSRALEQAYGLRRPGR